MASAIPLFLRANRRHLVELGVASVLINTAALAMPLFTMLVYDKAVGNQVHDTLWALAIGMGLVLVMDLLLRIARAQFIEHAGARWDAFLDQRLMRGVLHAPLSSALPPGDVVARSREVAAARDALSAQTLLGLADIPFVLLLAVATWLVAGPLVAIPVVTGLVMVALSLATQVMADRKQREATRAQREKIGVLIDVLAARDNLSGREAQAESRHRRLSLAGARAAARARGWVQAQGLIAPFLIGLATVALLVAGVYRVEAQALSVGGLISANMLAARMLGSLCMVAPLASRWHEFMQALQGLARTVNLEVQADAAARSAPAALAVEGVRVEQLNLRFANRQDDALRELTLALRCGELVALVGASGSGKSTLLRVLAGQLVPDSGRLSIGGERIAGEPERRWLREQATLKTQDPGCLAGTVREIVAGGHAALDDDTIATALRKTGLGPALDRGDIGLNTAVGTNGMGLSGGQKQSLALAAAITRGTPLLLLDEPTLGLDRQAQECVLDALGSLRDGRCVVIATHAAEVIQRADRVIVLDRGRVVADGSPDKLLSPTTHAPQRRRAEAPVSAETAESA